MVDIDTLKANSASAHELVRETYSTWLTEHSQAAFEDWKAAEALSLEAHYKLRRGVFARSAARVGLLA